MFVSGIGIPACGVESTSCLVSLNARRRKPLYNIKGLQNDASKPTDLNLQALKHRSALMKQHAQIMKYCIL